MATIKIANNAVTAKLIDPTPEIKSLVSELLSYRVNGAEYSSLFKSGRWNGQSSFFRHRQSAFPAGFVERVSGALRKKGHRIQRIQKPLPKPLGIDRGPIDAFGYQPEYDYQPEAVDRLLNKGSMIARLATGAGKSRVCCMAIARIKRPTLFITTRGALMYQMRDHLQASFEYRAHHGEADMIGAQVGVIGDGEWYPKKFATVAMVQTLAVRLKDPDPFSSKVKQAKQLRIQEKTKLLLSKFEFVVLEEAHEASGDSYFNILKHCTNAYYRLALTATPFMKDEDEANMRLMACVGGIGINVSEKKLIDLGILAKPYFKYIDVDKPHKLYKTTSWRRAYKIGITENEFRNRAIIEESRKMVSHGLTVMILVQHTKHGHTLRDSLNADGMKAIFIRGESSQSDRQRALKRLGSGEIDVLIGTNILDVGVDVPSVGGIVLAGGGKAEVALRQRIGRGLRRKTKGPNVAFIVDFTDSHNCHTRDHATQRRHIVENTEGFGENILDENAEFNFALFE
ncbi:MAG: DEAD/DEAH box helicase [Methylomicrobium sp.]|nr:DEAD/DEAH box helicase [Methylomicrobium sp.]